MEEDDEKSMNDSIPEELMLEIFARIPIKGLFQIRCTCSEWNNLIHHHPWLPTMHLQRQGQAATTDEPPLILSLSSHSCHKRTTLKVLQANNNSSPNILDFSTKARGRYNLENSCHGLLCFVKCGKEEEVIVSNPLKGQLLPLPHSTPISSYPHYTRYGLGFDSSTKQYKIIRVFSRDNPNPASAPPRYLLGAQVYTMGGESTGEWREVLGSLPAYPLHWKGVYVNCGILCWLANYEFIDNIDGDGDDDDYFNMVVSFDLQKEEFNTIPHQQLSRRKLKWFRLVDLRGFLGLVDFSLGTSIEIWRLKDHEKKAWVREYTLTGIRWGVDTVNLDAYMEVVGVIGEDEILLKHFDNLMIYNSSTDELRIFKTLTAAEDQDMGTPQVYLHRGSLISLPL